MSEGTGENRKGSVAGRAPTGVHYGYRIPKDERGLNRKGIRIIDPIEARVVIRIFEMFVSGLSPHAIVRQLNSEGISAKEGRVWSDSMVRGHPQRGSGILRNDIYIGRQIWNRQRFITDPNTGREIARLNPESEWIISELPELRIVPQHLWERAQMRLLELSDSPRAQRARQQKIWLKRPPKHLLDGLIKCGTCGGDLRLVRADRVSCRAGPRRHSCVQPLTLPLPLLQQVVLETIQNRLRSVPIAEALHRFGTEAKTQRERAKRARTALQREYASIGRQLANLIAAIAAGVHAPELRQRVDDLSRRKATVEAKLSEVRTESGDVESVAAQYRQRLAAIGKAFERGSTIDETMQALRAGIHKIVVRRAGDRMQLEFFGQIAEILAAGPDQEELAHAPGTHARTAKLIFGNWFRGSAGGHQVTSRRPRTI
jgi:site-specific DNA recombinase